ncbi:putative DNA-binding transcriptional regulator YafY [Nocardia caishijiensis]|uniref:DNA-binding transcriptional regulator YafY n=1 Tax=Nocardia caishijiensis TaxID=184756 RepID=A0ABQ6YJ54_9NOCA|nr:putative DNA-binding transcriptional regulator YafY [Nocardia caishijiensis]
MATLLLMQARGRVTAAQVAAELEVSVATARRDLEALSAAGIPVYPQAGRGGGWSLIGGARTDLSGLTAGETRALFLLAGPAAQAAPELKSALRKLVRALPQTFRADAAAAADAIVVDPARWGRPDSRPPAALAPLQRAVVDRCRVRIEYVRSGERTVRELSPWGLVEKETVWYLIAGTDRGRRTFRLDRIGQVTVLDEAFDRPADFDLPAEWARIVTRMEQRRAAVAATVLVSAALAPILVDQQGRNCTLLGPSADGRVRAEITADTAKMVARQLAGWGADVEVVGPPEVRAELAALGAELVRDNS